MHLVFQVPVHRGVPVSRYAAPRRQGSVLEANALARRIIGLAIEVHRHLGPGLSEVAYERALARDLTVAGIPFVRQVLIPVSYEGEVVAEYRPDFVVSDLVLLEIKSVERLMPVHEAQMLTYLRVTSRELG